MHVGAAGEEEGLAQGAGGEGQLQEVPRRSVTGKYIARGGCVTCRCGAGPRLGQATRKHVNARSLRSVSEHDYMSMI